MAPSLTSQLKTEALRLGFHLVGVTTPEQPAHLDIFERWLAEGYHADMAWIATERARQRRADPRLILPQCQSIIMLAIRYPCSPQNSEPSNGQIASYAWGADYHDVLPRRLKALAAFLENKVDCEISYRCYTDTGPVLERELAQRAGLGWIGKNGNLINPKIGSYFLLAEILLDLALPVDAPFTSDHCGTCTRCIAACPTNCILPNCTIDANRCLSYLTIESKEAIPLTMREKIGDWLFGCDICQGVCPWNHKITYDQVDAAFTPRSGVPITNLAAELKLSPQDFNLKFKGSPVKRTKRRGYLRNVAVVLGNLGDPSSVPALVGALTDIEPLVRAHAAWALAQIADGAAQAALQVAISRETDAYVRSEIQSALSSIDV
jgi:epoxyqueuosine reductase